MVSTTSCKENTANEITEDVSTAKDQIYLVNENTNGLVPVFVDINYEDTETQIENILISLKNDYEELRASASIPENININNLRLDGDNVIIGFSKEYSEMSTVGEVLCRSSIVKSLTAIDGINSVEFYIEGVPLKNAAGTIIGSMGTDDIVLDFTDTNSQSTRRQIKLYFSDDNGMYLVPVDYDVIINTDEEIERTILNMLMVGPYEDGLVSTIPEDTKINNVYTNKGICYVDLSEEFITNHSGGSTGESFTIYSIVNSLTELSNISKVQFLIDGEIKEEYKGHIEFDKLFEKNLDLVGK
jgi:germination protein M